MCYHKSHYCIDVKLDKYEGRYLLIHSYTGAIDEVSGEVVQYLNITKEFTKETAPFSDATFAALSKRGYITQKTLIQEKEYVHKLAQVLHYEIKNSAIDMIYLMVSYDCNFRCPYCFESEMSGGGSKWSKKRFGKRMIDKAFEAIGELESKKRTPTRRISLYGGEPLMKENLEIVEYILRRGTSLGYEFEAITNGHDLHHYAHLLAMGCIKELQITLDGAEKTHNSRRYHHEIGDSFDTIIKNIGLALNNQVDIKLRFNADANNYEEIKVLEKLFADLGYTASNHFLFYLARLHEISDQHHHTNDKISYLSKSEFDKKSSHEVFYVNRTDYGLRDKIIHALRNGTTIKMDPVFCRAQLGWYVFDPYGYLYTCPESVGLERSMHGTYIDGIAFNDEGKKWRKRNVGNTKRCSVCKYGLLCGGGCMSESMKLKNGYDVEYCRNFAAVFKRSANQAFEEWQIETNA